MPPKAKFDREEIIDAALQLVRESGFQALTARALAIKLGSSARPIFTVFQGMDEVGEQVIKAAKNKYNQYIGEGLASGEEHIFKMVGIQYIRFALDEPQLFRLLFMSEQKSLPSVGAVLPIIDDNYKKILTSIEEDYHFSPELALKLYQHMWIYTHGIAALCATDMCSFRKEEISEMMSEVCASIIKKLKNDET